MSAPSKTGLGYTSRPKRKLTMFRRYANYRSLTVRLPIPRANSILSEVTDLPRMQGD